MKNLAIIIPIFLIVIISAGCSSHGKNSRNPLPDISLDDRADLEKARKLAKQGVNPLSTAVDSLKMAADKAMMQGPYCWPNPDTPDGLPYVRHDGVVNPEYYNFDSRTLSQMAYAVFTHSVAWFYTGHEPYAEWSLELLRTWFLDPATRINPHLEYGQAIPGRTEGRGIGIIETGNLIKVVNGSVC
jgi:hypothetical protein